MNIFKRLEELSFPLGEYVVIGSGALAARGIREANDLDIVVTDKLLQKLINSREYKEVIKDGRLFLENNDVDVTTKLPESYSTSLKEAIKTADIINGYPFLNILETIKFKKVLGREKDYNDIKLINEYLKNQQDN
jgi:FlaA1/EpsC-like NDP-sugar epimerase